MTGLLNVTVVGDDQVVAAFERMPASIVAVLSRKMDEQMLLLQGYIQQSKLSGQVLNVVTGALRRSIHAQPTVVDGDTVVGSVRSSGDVKYAAIHEFGGRTPAHDIFPRKAEALSFIGAGGSRVFAKVVHHPGSQIPERSFMRTGLADRAEDITIALKEAVIAEMVRDVAIR